MKDLSDWKTNSMQKHIPNMSRDGSQTKRKRDATTGSTATVHLLDENQTSNRRLNKQDKSVEDKQTNRLKKTLKSSQYEVFGIGGKVDRFFLSGDDITLFSIRRFIRKLFLDILKHNKDPMTGLYDYDGIAQSVIDLVKK